MAIPLEAPSPPVAGEPAPDGGGYGWFLGLGASWFGAWGMQNVLFSWLVVGELGETAERAGLAHFGLVLPGLLFILVGGAAADRVDRRRLIAGLHAVWVLLILALAAAVFAGALTLALVIAYALCMGTVAAFANPARDAMLNDVAGANLLRAVVGVTLVQFAMSGVGAGLGGVARYIGTESALVVQAVLLSAGVGIAFLLPRRASAGHGARAPIQLREVGAGLVEVWQSPVLRPTWLLVILVGLFFMGPYNVVYPLLVRDYYQGDVGDLSILMMTFPIGTVVVSLALLGRGRIRRKGRALAIAQAVAGLALVVIGLGGPFSVAVAGGLLWGLGGGVFMNAGRTIFQETAPLTHRARVLSVYAVGLIGAGTVGSPTAGVLAGWLGPANTFLVCGSAMIGVVALAYVFTGIRRVR